MINPLNNIPDNLDTSNPHSHPSLSKTRQVSTIPKDANNTQWVFPSEAQFFTALVRKGKPVPDADIPAMLAIHNELNEQVWREIKDTWEHDSKQIFLARFRGRPNEWSPLAWLYFWRYGVRPYDRHDWIIACDDRGKSDDQTVFRRYVIDYYANGHGDFSCVIRPALDSFEAVKMRIRKYFFTRTPG